MVAALAGETPPAPADTTPGRAYRWVLLTLTVVPAVTQLAHLVATTPRWRFDIYEEDAYYYLGVARSLAEGDGSTFTGLTATNGYHPLWMALLWPLAFVFRGPHAFVGAMVVLSGVLWALGVREALRIGRLIGSWRCAAGAIFAYAVLAVFSGHLSFNGMESTLVMPLLLWAVRLAVEAGDATRDDLRVGLVLALICLARLDAVLAAGPLALVVMVRSPAPSRRLLARALALAAPTAVALGTYVAVNLAVFGTPTPVSGQAKALGGPFFNTGPVHSFVRAGEISGRSVYFGAFSLVLVGVAVLTGAWRSDRHLARLTACTLALVAGEALLLAYLTFGTSYILWYWYHYLIPVYSFCAALIVLRWALGRYGAAVGRLGVAAGILFTVAQVLTTFRPEQVMYPGSMEAAEWVDRSLPDDAVMAIGDRAGMFGYLTDRPLLQLEGLMADAELLDDISRGTVVDRMVAEGVEYYAHYDPAGERITVWGRPCERLSEPFLGRGPKVHLTMCDDDLVFASSPDDRGERFRIWRFRPELNGP